MPSSTDGRRVLTFKPRRGRVTPRQQRALDELWTSFGVDVAAAVEAGPVLDLVDLFGRRAPVALEIGFGMGEATAAMAEAGPETDLLAVDVHTPGAGALLAEIEQRGLRNVRVAVGDALDLIDLLPPAGLDEVRVFFPDPWPKARHCKRRLVQAPFLCLAATRLKSGGRLHVATDWEPYAERVLALVHDDARFENPHGGFAPRPSWRPQTRFERRGIEKGHRVRDVVAVRR